MKLIVFVTLFIAAFAAEKPYLGFNLPQFSSLIEGGINANKGEFPYLVSLQWGTNSSSHRHFCGGSILNEKWILTSGFCARIAPLSNTFVVKAGKYNITKTESEEQQRTVEKKIIYMRYQGYKTKHDIALLKLSSPLNFNSAVSPIKLPQMGSIPYGSSTVSGWGLMWAPGPPQLISPAVLQKAVVPIIDFKTCRRTLNKILGESSLYQTNICTGPLSRETAICASDEGGPLVVKNWNGTDELVGIVSWSVSCGKSSAPTVYTRVSAYNLWIQSVINSN